MSVPFRPDLFEVLPIIGILRGLPPQYLESVVTAVREGGLTNLEITMNTPDASAQIRAALDASEGNLNVGAGTVTNLTLLDEALVAGASFIVTPTVAQPVIERCRSIGIPVFPGAFSPTEIVRAWDMGAAMVKIFPAEVLGPAYIRALKGPFPNIRLMPTGGVDLTTLPAYVKAGASGFGLGSPLFDRARITAGDWRWLRTQASSFVEAWKNSAKQ